MGGFELKWSRPEQGDMPDQPPQTKLHFTVFNPDGNTANVTYDLTLHEGKDSFHLSIAYRWATDVIGPKLNVWADDQSFVTLMGMDNLAPGSAAYNNFTNTLHVLTFGDGSQGAAAETPAPHFGLDNLRVFHQAMPLNEPDLRQQLGKDLEWVYVTCDGNWAELPGSCSAKILKTCTNSP